jgi:hypothetical protein
VSASARIRSARLPSLRFSRHEIANYDDISTDDVPHVAGS